ncbi:DMT family transporter [Intestinimonas massiliensis]|uniref:DMT family transporter n=1 Tax=Intestinimonas massiliensis (ex Afouda et al. 2020) TaxID=1673721 RepID=A0AAW5JNL8_9FIRM|nr:DMT family transporter [Intestinimonas sp. UBA1698]MCG4525740.1 DMT family transporter [Intestinimonas massiliensis (ex Afouda et al. 2020)]MCQ4769228.1 DMT family transporter [Intestinimonas massiliensis (ex Afouda et al. 2020)]MCQ4805796.1 DMT family transporter [Intestinimonas massiliensis (ex Afouda et al. 2020)]
MHRKGIFCTALSALLFGVTPLLGRLTYGMGSNALTLTFYRNALVILPIFLLLRLRKISLRISPRQLATVLAVGILGRGFTTLMLYDSYRFVGIGIATTLHFLYPVFVAVLCRVVFHDRLGRVRLAALVLAGIGVLCFLERDSGPVSGAGLALATISGFTYACYMVCTEKTVIREMDPLVVSFYMAIGVSCAMLAVHIPTRQIVFALPPKAMLLTLLVALCTSFLGVVLFQIGICYLSATTAAIFSLLEPIASNLCGILVLSEPVTPAKALGSLIILAAVFLMARFKPAEAADPAAVE